MPDDALSPTPPARLSWFFWTLLAFLVFLVAALYISRMSHDYTTYDQKRASARYETLAKLRAADEKALTTADWVSQDKGVVRIPIEEAMAREIETLRAKPVQAGDPIPGATPAATNAAPAPAAKAPPAPAPTRK